MGYPQKSSSSYDNYHAATMQNDNADYCKNARIILILGVSLLYLVEGAINGGQKNFSLSRGPRFSPFSLFAPSAKERTIIIRKEVVRNWVCGSEKRLVREGKGCREGTNKMHTKLRFSSFENS